MPYVIEKFDSKKYKVRKIQPDDNGEIVYFSKDFVSLPTAYKQLHAVTLNGDGLFDYVKGIFSGSNTSPVVEKFIKSYGDWKVTGFAVHRVPIEKVFKTILNTISLGVFKKEAEKKGYDDVFHLFAIFEITNKNGKVKYFLTEKTPNIVIEERKGFHSPKTDKIDDLVTGTVNEDVTVRQMFERTIQRFKDNKIGFARYDPKNNNCQVYINLLMESLGVNELKDFIYQPMDGVLQGIAQGAATQVTSLGHLFGRLTGKALMKKNDDEYKSIEL